MSDLRLTAREVLEHALNHPTEPEATTRVIAAAALHIREGLDNLAKAQRKAGKRARAKAAIREAMDE